MGCSTFQLRVIITTLNSVIVFFGIACLALGIYVSRDDDLKEASDKMKNGNGDLYKGAYIMIAVSVLVVIFSFIGCYGAIRKSKCCLLSYFLIIAALLIVEITGFSIVWINAPDMKNAVNETLTKELHKYKEGIDSAKLFDFIQKNLKCCGVNSERDFKSTPKSCYNPDSPGKTYEKGCLEKVDHFIREMVSAVGGIVTAFITIIQVVTMMMVLRLYCLIRQDKDFKFVI
ncbi:Uncharacterised protein r2_g518 [Pycnogonum litorale]